MTGERAEKIPFDDPRWQAAQNVLDAMHAYFELDPFNGAVQWIEDTDGRLVVFTRGEYKDSIRNAIGENLHPDKFFEIRELEEK